jgi:DNA-binding SARP family transcriptional activator/streptogramin lyase
VLEFRILGELDVRDDGRRIDFREGNDAALLTLLLLHAGQALSVERIVDELWPEDPPASARKIVQNSVSRLRRALGEERIETRAHTYVLHADPEEIDAARFEQLVAESRGADALHLWRGPPTFDRDRFEELYLTALEQRLAADVDAGRNGAVAELESLVRRHPYRERLRALQMRALYADGRQADALEAYRAASRTLRDDLGLEPGQELRELEQAILRQEVAAPQRPPAERRGSRRRLVAALVVALAATAALAVALRPDASSPADVVVPNSLAVLDPANGRIVGDVRVGAQPRGVAVGAGGVWVANTGDETVTGIDPDTLQPFKTYGVGGAALDIAIRNEILWVALDGAKAVARIDTRSEAVETFSVPGNASVYAVDVGPGAVWVGAATIYRLDPRSGAIVQKPPTDCCVPIDLVVTPHSIWTNAFQNAVRLSLGTLREQVAVPLNSLEDHFAYGYGAVWVCASRFVGDRIQSSVWKLDDLSGATQAQTRVGDYATAIAAGAGAVWVASYNAGTVSKLDPATGRLLETIRVGGHPDGIATGDGRVWVAVD